MSTLSRSLSLLMLMVWATACHSTETATEMDAAIDLPTDINVPEDRITPTDLAQDRVGRDVRVDVIPVDTTVELGRRCPFAPTDTDAGVDAGTTGPRPRLIGPLSTTRVTTQRPSLRYELPAELTRARLELCDDPGCRRVFLTIPLPETSGVGRVRPESVLRPGVVFWRMLADLRDGGGERVSYTWEFGVGHRDTPLDSSHGTISDFEGDGFDDIAIADDVTLGGIIYAFSGSATGVRTTPSATLLAPVVQVSNFGINKAVGDVDRDGLADLVTTEGDFSTTNSAQIYRGCHEGLAETPSQIISQDEFGGHSNNISALGDVNGDGFADFAKWGYDEHGDHAHVLLGSSIGLRTVRLDTNIHCPSCLTTVIYGLGDVNGDGYADILWLAGFGTPIAGVVLGRSDAPSNRIDFTIEPVPRMLSRFGREGLGVGDLDGDGMSEFIIRDLPYTYLYRGARDLTGVWPIARIDPPGRSDVAILYVGAPIPGDVDGDGVLDMVFPAPIAGYENPDAGTFPGTVYRYHLSITGGFVGETIIRAPEETVDFGRSVTVQGDLNGDGFSDLVTSAFHLTATNSQRLEIYWGGAGGLTELSRQDLALRLANPMFPYIMPK